MALGYYNELSNIRLNISLKYFLEDYKVSNASSKYIKHAVVA